MNLDEINYSIQNLFNKKTRSLLTILSILIGISAIFAIVSFGLGIQNYVDVLAEEAGADKLYIQAKGIGVPGTDENFFITKDDVDFVRKINGVEIAEGMYMKIGEIEFRGQSKFNFVVGYNTKETDFMFESFGVDIHKGRFLKRGDVNKVLLGYNYIFEDKVFKRVIEPGEKVDINGVKFEVVGIVGEVGNPQDDQNIYLTFDAMEQLYPGIKDKFGIAMLQAERGVDPEALAAKIEEKLRKFKGQEEGKEDFFVQSFADIIETFGAVIVILNGVLFLIAFVSLIVAGVNIMNTMYTSVLERTKEIGVMKAIGARNSDILFVFVFESGLLGAVGGLIGVGFGYLIARIGGEAAKSAGYSSLQPIFPLYLLLGCVMFSFFVGALAGLLPARRASKLNPVDALRYE